MLYGKSILAIIPVRLGSKRLKLKNIRIFKGKYLFLNTLFVAKKCKYIDKIIVSSEKKKSRQCSMIKNFYLDIDQKILQKTKH